MAAASRPRRARELLLGVEIGSACKPLRVLSGGQRGRVLFGKLMLTRPQCVENG